MTRTWTRSALAVLVALLAAAPAFAHTPPPPGGGCRLIRGQATPETTDDVSVCRQDVFFHKGSAPIGNLAKTEQVTLPSWDTTKPTGLPAEAGAYVSSSEIDVAAQGDTAGRAQFTGTFTGTLDTLGIRMYLRSPFNEVADASTLPATVYLEVDGEVLHNNYDTAAIDLALVETEGVYRLDAALRGLYGQMEDLGMDLSPTKEHTIKIGLVGWFIPGSETVFLYDADEFQSGMFFNLEPTSMAGFTKIDVQA
jgi:hypothetical protein